MGKYDVKKAKTKVYSHDHVYVVCDMPEGYELLRPQPRMSISTLMSVVSAGHKVRSLGSIDVQFYAGSEVVCAVGVLVVVTEKKKAAECVSEIVRLFNTAEEHPRSEENKAVEEAIHGDLPKPATPKPATAPKMNCIEYEAAYRHVVDALIMLQRPVLQATHAVEHDGQQDFVGESVQSRKARKDSDGRQ